MKCLRQNKLSEAGIKAVAKTFSDMAFIDAIPAGDEPEAFAYSHILRISILEPIRGHITLYLPVECKRIIVENIYGTSWENLLATEIDDCLLEMLNVLAGNFLSEYCGTGSEYNVSLPELLYDSSEIEEYNRNIKLDFDAEGVPFKAAIALK